jgi:hypothetical protein
MHLSQFCILSAAGILSLPASVLAAPAKPQPKTAAAVIAADEGWSKAEETKDVAYVDNLLLPGYRSVSPDGSVHDKAAILAHMQTSMSVADRTAAVEKYRAAHPYETSALIAGDTAVLTFHLKAQPPEKGITSSDIFVYRDGQWHAIYSQHTDAEK